MKSSNRPSTQWEFLSPPDSAVQSCFSHDLAGRLMKAAHAAREHAYAPYSRIRVGASVLMTDQSGRDGPLCAGCNVENASFGATMCAERSAIFSAVAAGGQIIRMLALTLDTGEEEEALSRRSPCGLCRQVISEFANDATAIVIDAGSRNAIEFTGEVMGIADLLPWGFCLPPE